MDTEEYEHYLDIDADAETEGMLTDEQLCERLGSSQESNVDEEKEVDSPPPPPPSNAEVVQALDIIRRRVYHNGLHTDPK